MALHGTPTRAAGLLVALGVSYLALTAFSGGITNRTQKNGTGCTCHGATPTGSVNISILGPDTLGVGETGVFNLVVEGGPLGAAGTNIAALTGTLSTIAGQGLQKLGDELTHSSPKSPDLGTVSFQFSYTAPASPGIDTLFANGNSVDLSGDPSGDQWNFATRKPVVTVPATSVQDAAFPSTIALRQNYPNPFNPSTTIEFTLPESRKTRLEVFSAAGERVAMLIDGELSAGTHRRQFDATGLASGLYVYRLVAGTQRVTRTMMLLR